MFANRYTLYKPGFSVGWLKNNQIVVWARVKPSETPIYGVFRRFSTDPLKLPPKSVGASVDKVFAILCRPYKPWPSSFRSKNDQCALETLLLDKSRIFFGFCGESFA
jgi:hypothetical protein